MVDVSDHGVVEDTSVTQVGQVGHIFSTVKLGRVDLADLLLSEGLHLSVELDRHLASRLASGEALQISPSLRAGHPHRLFSIVGLGLVGLLHLVGDQEPGGGIWLRSLGLLAVARHLTLSPLTKPPGAL